MLNTDRSSSYTKSLPNCTQLVPVMSSSVPTTVRSHPWHPTLARHPADHYCLSTIHHASHQTLMLSAHFPLSKMDADQTQDALASSLIPLANLALQLKLLQHRWTCTFCACTLDSCQGPPISLGVPLFNHSGSICTNPNATTITD